MVRILKLIITALVLIFWLSFCTGKLFAEKDSFQLLWTDSIAPSAINAVAKVLLDSLKISVQIIRGPSLPDSVWSASRKRYRSFAVLQWMAQKGGLNYSGYQLLLTDKDIGVDYGGEYLRGANGLSFQGGQFAIISDYRLQQLDRSRDSIDYYLGKVALHETGHLFGLPHCTKPRCIMESVEVKQHITSVEGFCEDCKKKVFHRCEK